MYRKRITNDMLIRNTDSGYVCSDRIFYSKSHKELWFCGLWMPDYWLSQLTKVQLLMSFTITYEQRKCTIRFR